jgi:hypothetical protein
MALANNELNRPLEVQKLASRTMQEFPRKQIGRDFGAALRRR